MITKVILALMIACLLAVIIVPMAAFAADASGLSDASARYCIYAKPGANGTTVYRTLKVLDGGWCPMLRGWLHIG